MKKYLNYSFLLSLTICFSIGCKVPKPFTPEKGLVLPESFADSKDTANSATIQWRNFFKDEYLVGLIEEALKNNYDVLAISQKIDMANATVKESEGALKPFVTGTVAPAIRRFGLYTMDGAGNASTFIKDDKIVPEHLPDFFVGLQTTWEIDAWHKLKNRKKAAVMRYLASVEGKNAVITNLIADIALTYYDLVMLDNQIEVLKDNIVLQDSALTIVKIQKQAGVANELAVKQFEAQLYNTQAILTATQQTITENENKINFLLGRFAQPIQRTRLNLLQVIPPSVQMGVPTQLLSNRPDIRQAEFDLMAAQADIQAARAAFYPTLNITGGLGIQAFNPLLLASPKSIAYTVLGGLVAPIFNKSAIEATYINANATQREAFFNYQKSILNGYVEVNNEMAKLNNLVQQQDLKSKEATVLRQAIDISSELFKVGRANYLELLTAQQNTLSARLELIDLKKEQFHAVTNMYKALGGGWR